MIDNAIKRDSYVVLINPINFVFPLFALLGYQADR